MDIYDHRDYRALIREKIALLPQKGYGQLGKLARAIGVNATLVSQILNGKKNMTEDQAYLAAGFFDFNEHETAYLLLLVQRERAGGHQLKNFLDQQISAAQKRGRQVKANIRVATELTYEQQAVFYSSWLYAAVRSLTSIEEFQSRDAIAKRLALSRGQVDEIADWLVRYGLCLEEGGCLKIGPAPTYVDRESPLAARHHANWRQKAVEAMGDVSEANFHFTATLSLSRVDQELFRKELAKLVGALAKRVEKTDPELLAAFNIDFFLPK